MAEYSLKCELCGKCFIAKYNFTRHLKSVHDVSIKEYYDKYFKKDTDGVCLVCGTETQFRKRGWKYNKFCSTSCGVKHQNMSYTDEERKSSHRKRINTIRTTLGDEFGRRISNGLNNRTDEEKELTSKKLSETYYRKYDNLSEEEKLKLREHRSNIYKEWHSSNTEDDYKLLRDKKRNTRWKNIHTFEDENNCVCITTLINEFGQGWKSLEIPIIRDGANSYVSKEFIPEIKDYASKNHRTCRSSREIELAELVSNICEGDVLTSERRIIPPYELDIYIPKLKLAIEYNGNYFHSDITGTPIDYHLNKSIRCRELGIRLIHIYEFENFAIQKELLVKLLSGKDDYPIDFNKNNLVGEIPNLELIYFDDRLRIFGAGKLGKN